MKRKPMPSEDHTSYYLRCDQFPKKVIKHCCKDPPTRKMIFYVIFHIKSPCPKKSHIEHSWQEQPLLFNHRPILVMAFKEHKISVVLRDESATFAVFTEENPLRLQISFTFICIWPFEISFTSIFMWPFVERLRKKPLPNASAKANLIFYITNVYGVYYSYWKP